MLRALLRKQFLELNVVYYQNRKTGKRRSKGGIIGYSVLFALVFLMLALMFFGIALQMGSVLLKSGFMAGNSGEWVYFAMMGILAVLLGVFGSVFNTYAGLYRAKDNEMLLAMPIPPRTLLAARLSTVIAMSLLYSALVWIPGVVVYWILAFPKLETIVYPVLLMFVIAVLVTVITCLMGWLVALLSTRVKHKSAVVVMLSLGFFAGYYYVCFNLEMLVQKVIENSGVIAENIRHKVWILYCLGKAAAGEGRSMLLFCLITVALFFVCCFVLDKTFLRIVTMKTAVKKAEYKETAVKLQSVEKALLQKELRRFTASPTYMMNAGLGIVILPVIGVVMLLKADVLLGTLALFSAEFPSVFDLLPPAAAGILIMIAGTDAVSASSISLEGKNLWILQSLPVRTWEVLRAKLKLHIFLNIPSAVIAVILVSVAAGFRLFTTVCVTAAVGAYVCFSASAGLMLNLLRPSLNWTSETAPVKQSLPVFIALFGSWGAGLAVIGVFYFLMDKLSPDMYLILCTAIFVLVTRLVDRWLMKKGTSILESL